MSVFRVGWIAVLAMGVGIVAGCAGEGNAPEFGDEAHLTVGGGVPTALLPLSDAVRAACAPELGATYCSAEEAEAARVRCEARLSFHDRLPCAFGGCVASFTPRRAPGCRSGSTYPDRAACDHPVTDDCSFYRTCVDAALPCGEEGYALQFGERLCYRFIEDEARFSPHGQRWLRGIRSCLEESLVPVLSAPGTCTSLSQAGFAAHAPCYLAPGNSFCDLSPLDVAALATSLGRDLFTRDAFTQMRDVAKSCVRDLLTESVAAARSDASERAAAFERFAEAATAR